MPLPTSIFLSTNSTNLLLMEDTSKFAVLIAAKFLPISGGSQNVKYLEIKHGSGGLWSEIITLDATDQITSVSGGTRISSGHATMDSGVDVRVTATTYDITVLSVIIEYYFRMRYINASGQTAYSNELIIRYDGSVDTTPPHIDPASIIVGIPTATGVTISWTAEADATNSVEYSDSPLFTSLISVPAISGVSPTATLTTLQPNTTYYARVRSTDLSGNSSAVNIPGGTFTTAAGLAITWAKLTGGATADQSNSVAQDVAGNVYVAGQFAGALIEKYDSSGVLQWRKQLGSSSDIANGIAVDKYGDIVVVGTFYQTIILGADTYTSLGNADIFVVKLRPDGTFVWSKRVGGTADDKGLCVAVDPNNANVVIGGSFNGSVSIEGNTVSSSGGQDSLIVKYSRTGVLLWYKNFTCVVADAVYGLAIDSSGNIIAAGSFVTSIDFGAGAQTTGETPNSLSDAYIVKLGAGSIGVPGALSWSKVFGNVGADQSWGVALDTNDDVYVAITGGSGSIDFHDGHGSWPVYSDTNAFLINLSGGDGGIIWSQGFVMPDGGRSNAKSVTVSDDGLTILLAGSFNLNINFGQATQTSVGNDDAFVAAFDPGGNNLWSKRFGGGLQDSANAISATGGNVVIAGVTGGGDFNGTILSQSGTLDGFVCKFPLP